MTRPSAGPAAVEQSVSVLVRELVSAGEYEACVGLQRETWGEDFADYVPASLLKVGQLVGGVTVGAFTPAGRMVGFVYGLTGVQAGQLVHWSHMLAVHPEFRDHGLGRRLKQYQRELLQARGVARIYWTFDPLVARNAHLNLNRLGVQIQSYVPDMYGDTGSPLHAFGTDRFVVAWSVAATEPPSAAPATSLWRHAPLVASAAPGDADVRALQAALANGAGGAHVTLVRVEVPAQIEALAIAEARRWRTATRTAFVRLLEEGYRVIGFFTEERRRCFYVLARTDVDAAV